jgi:Glycosyl transferases group 1
MKTLLCLILTPALALAYTINILYWNNGVGLTSDYNVLKQELTQLGHTVNPVHIRVHEKLPSIPKADINIFLEHTFDSLFRFAKVNYFIPNPEWCIASKETIKKFDLILCRTQEVERIFHPLNKNTYYLGFTSPDRNNNKHTKNYDSFFHLKGQSRTKGTAALLNLWTQNPNLPPLFILAYKDPNPNLSNLKVIPDFLSEPDLIYWENTCGIHLCPSETEGFGHSISEAMSTGAIVITTDAPPMNEFITDPRCLIHYTHTTPQHLATKYHFDPAHLETLLENLTKLPKDELQKIGQRNRTRYLHNKQDFKDRLALLFAPGTL